MLPTYTSSPAHSLLLRTAGLCVALLVFFVVQPATAQGPNISYAYTSNIGSGFHGANSIAVDSAGNVFIADSGTDSLYKETLNPDGTYTQSTVSTGAGQPVSVAIDSSGNLYVLDGAHVFKETLAGGSYTESPVVSGLNAASSVAVDPTGNVYVNETGTGRVLLEKLSGATYTQIVISSGLNTSNGEGGIAVDTSGSVYVCDPGNNRVLKETFAGGAYTQSVVVDSSTVVLNQVTNVNINNQFTAYGVAFDSSGNVLIASQNFGIFRAVPDGTGYTVKNISLNTSTPLGGLGMAINSHGDLYLASSNAVEVLLAYELAESSSAENFGSQNIGTTTAAQTATFTFDVGGTLATIPYGVSTQGDLTLDFQPAATQAANVCVAGKTYNAGDTCTVAATFTPTRPGARYGAVALFAPSGTPIATSYLQGVGVGPQVSFSPGLPDNNLGQGFDDVVTVDSSSNYFFDGALASLFNAHPIISVPPTNSVFTTGYPGYNYFNDGSGNGAGDGLVIDGAGNIVLTDAVSGETSVAAYDLNPTLPKQTGNGGTLIGNYGPAFLAGVLPPPSSVTPPLNGRPAIDGAGNVYFSDDNQNQILEEQYIHGWYNKQIVIATGLNNPGDVVVDAAGAVYAADTGNNRIVKETPNGDGTYIQTVVDSSFAYPPEGLAIDRIGNLYVSVFNDVPGSLPFILKETFANNTYTQSTLPIRGALGLDVDSAGNIFAVETGDGNFDTLIALDVSTPPSLMFASTAVGSTSSDSPQTVTIVNNGNAPLTVSGSPAISAGFTLSPSSTCPQATLAPQASCTFNINFVPTQSGFDNGTLTITDNHLGSPGATQVIKLNGQGTGTGTIAATLSPSTYNYGSVNVGSSASQSFTLANTGTSSINIASISLLTPVFTVGGTTCGTSLAAGTSCAYTVVFKPTATGALTTTFTVTDDAGTQTATLTGAGAQASAAQAALTPGTGSFGTVTVGATSAPTTFTLTNAGNATLSITSFGINGASSPSFLQGASSCGASLAAGASCTIAVSFTPTSAGTFTATLSVTDAVGTQTAALTGTATTAAAPQATLTPATATFGSVTSGSSSAAQTFMLTNAGNAALPISSIALSGAAAGNFAITTNTCGSSLAAGSSCTTAVTFSPSSTGSFAATLSVTDTVGTQISSLTGTGAAPAPTSDFTVTSTPASQSVTSGSSATYNVAVASTSGSFTQAVALTASGLPPGATVTFSPASVTPGSSGAQATMIVQTVAQQAAARDGLPQWPFTTPVFAALLLLLPGKRFRSGKKGWGVFTSLACIVALLGIAVSTIGCGAGFALPSSAKTYTITVTGTSGSDTHSTTVTLTVQ
jgi:trimeric autotransporter adhesin